MSNQISYSDNYPFDRPSQDAHHFHIKTIREEPFLDSQPFDESEVEFSASMYNFGDEEDLPDSDRETICRTQGISRHNCFNR